MIFRLLLIASVLIGALLNSYAQQKGALTPQIVELKDGSRLLGTVISDTDYAVRLVILTGDTLDIGYKYISSVGDPGDSRIRRVSTGKAKLPKRHLSKTIVANVAIGGTIQANEEAGGLQVNASIMKMLNEKIGIGLGSGYITHNKRISFYPINSSYIPIYVTSKYILSETKDIKPFVQISAGYGIGVNQRRVEFQTEYNTQSGVFGQLQLGTSISNRGSYNLSVGLNLNLQKTKGVLSGLDWNNNLPFTTSFDLVMIRPGFTIGLIF